MFIQTHSPTHHLRQMPTAHLAATMALLQLNSGELRQKIESELDKNPALEFVDTELHSSCHHRLRIAGACPICTRPSNSPVEKPIIFVSSSRELGSSHQSNLENNEHTDEWLTETQDLPTFVFRQIAVDLPPADRPIAVHILTSLNEDGLLDIPLFEISQYHHVPLARVRKVLRLIQMADPLGVGSPTPAEALLVQIEVLSETHSIPPKAAIFIKDGMELLSRKAYQELARRFKIPFDEVTLTAHYIADNLNPFPARSNWGQSNSVPSNPVYTQPDIVISRLNEDPNPTLVVEILAPYASGLRVNPLFKEALAQAPAEKLNDWQTSLEAAILLVKCLNQRNQALVRLLDRLVVFQREYILYGDAYLLPITRAQIADEIEVHESTISRAVAEKTVQLPNRQIVPLSRLFDRSLHIRTALRQLIEQETQPLSDVQLAGLLEEQGYPIARRTVAKYRAMEGILPAKLRHTEWVMN